MSEVFLEFRVWAVGLVENNAATKDANRNNNKGNGNKNATN